VAPKQTHCAFTNAIRIAKKGKRAIQSRQAQERGEGRQAGEERSDFAIFDLRLNSIANRKSQIANAKWQT
jgi:hypothetical protein